MFFFVFDLRQIQLISLKEKIKEKTVRIEKNSVSVCNETKWRSHCAVNYARLSWNLWNFCHGDVDLI